MATGCHSAGGGDSVNVNVQASLLQSLKGRHEDGGPRSSTHCLSADQHVGGSYNEKEL